MDERQKVGNEYSSLTVLILLIYVLATFISGSVLTIPIRIGGFLLVLNWKMIDLVAPAAGLLAGIGTYEMISRRSLKPFREKLLHTIIPFVTTLALGIILRNFGVSAGWAVSLVLGGLLLYLVFMSECIVCDPTDPRMSFVRILLTALAYTTFLIIAVGVRVNISRLIIEIPIVLLGAFILSMRIFTLQESGGYVEIKAGAVALLLSEAAAALHYWPIKSLSYSIVLIFFFYILTSVILVLPRKSSFIAALKSQAWAVLPTLVLFVYFEIF